MTKLAARLPNVIQGSFVVGVDQDQTAEIVQSDLRSTPVRSGDVFPLNKSLWNCNIWPAFSSILKTFSKAFFLLVVVMR